MKKYILAVLLILSVPVWSNAGPPSTPGCTGYFCNKSLSELLGGMGYTTKGQLIVGTGASAASALTAAADYSILHTKAGETTGLKWITPVASAFLGWNSSGVLTQLTSISMSDDAAQFYNSAAPTKLVKIDASNQTAGNTGTIQAPNGGTAVLPNGTAALQDAAPTTIVNSGDITVTTKNTYVICTGACSITLPVAAAGIQMCARNAPGSATVITLVNRASQYYELTTHAAWATANQKLVSGGVATDAICVVGYDATHYATMSYTGAWTDTAP